MIFLKKNTLTQQPESVHSRRFTPMQYIAAVAVMSISVTAISYAAANLTIFSTGPISAAAMNDNFAKLEAEIRSNQVPAGTLVAFSGTTAPSGYIQCPTTSTSVSRTAFAALFAAIGTTWGGGDGMTTFGVPWFPEGYALLQTSSSIGVQTVGQVINHTHSLNPTSNGQGGGGDSAQKLLGNGGSSFVTGLSATGGTDNLAAGTKVMILVKL